MPDKSTPAAEPTTQPLIRPGEQPLLVFISSVISADVQWARDAAVQTLDQIPYLHRWAFEYTPASSATADDTYLAKVRQADIVIWLAGAVTTEPVRKEIREALASNRRLWIFKLPCAARMPETESLLKEVGIQSKWVEVPSPEQLSELIDLTRGDEFVRAIRNRPGMGRIALLEELARASRARNIERWQALGLSRTETSSLADDIEIGDPETTLGTPIKEPICVISGDFGAGKSLIAERLLQRAIREARDSADVPIPVFLRARDALGRVQSQVETLAAGLGDPRAQGAYIVIDGADEVGIDAASELLAEARLLANTWPKTRLVITSRPIGVSIGEDELVSVASQPEDRVDAIIERIAGRSVSVGEKANWPDAIRAAVGRPLFAVLMATHLRESGGIAPKSTGELLSWMVDRSLGKHRMPTQDVDEALQKLAILTTDRRNSPIAAVEAAPDDLRRSLLDSRLVVAGDGLLWFPLPILAQWFAAKALLRGSVCVDDLVLDQKRLAAWYYPLIMAVGMASHEQASALLTPLAKKNPGLAAMVCEEAIARWGLANNVKPPPMQESGARIRATMQAWVDGIGPLAELVAPLRPDGRLPALGVAISDAWLYTSWYQGSDPLPDVVELPVADRPFGSGATGWHFMYGARPGHQPSWAWRWTLEELRGQLSKHVERRTLPIGDGPLQRERLWRLVLLLAGKGSLYYDPIPIEKIEKRVLQLGDLGPFLNFNGHDLNLAEIRQEIEGLKAKGVATLDPPWPGPDLPGGRSIWSGYSDKQILARAKAVFGGALEGYRQIVEKWFPNFASRMELAALLPAKVVGFIWIDHEEPRGVWHLEPLPRGASCSVEFQLAPGGQNPAVVHDEGLKDIIQRMYALRPEIAEWYSYSYHHGHPDIFDSDSATRMAYDWIKNDLRRLRWLG